MADQEMEIRVNKRWVERGIFLLVIIALVVLYFLKGNAGRQEDLSANVTLLNKQLSEKDSQITLLLKNLTEARQLANATSKAVPQQQVNTTPTPAPAPVKTLSGVITYDWNVEGVINHPSDYNAVEIAGNESLIHDLQVQLNNTDSSDTQKRSDLRAAISAAQSTIGDLSIGPDQYELHNVTVFISNGKDLNAAVKYTLCWPNVECQYTVANGTINVISGQDKNATIDLSSFPKLMLINTKKILQLTLIQYDSTTNSDAVVFSDQKTFKSP